MNNKIMSIIKKVIIVFLVFFISFAVSDEIKAINISTSKLSTSGKIVKVNDEIRITNGVTEGRIVTDNKAVITDGKVTKHAFSNQVIGHVCEVEPWSNAEIVVTRAKPFDGTNFGMSTVSEQAEAYENATGKKVIFAINGQFYNMQTGQPELLSVINGELVNKEYKEDKNGNIIRKPFFAILKDGTAVIREPGADYSDCLYAIGGDALMGEDGKWITPSSRGGFHTRSLVGVTADGTVMFYTTDGMKEPETYGETLKEAANKLLAMGCIRVLNVDGGGSSTFLSRREGENTLIVRNNPLDGDERPVGDSILVVSNVSDEDTFDHVEITPNNQIYGLNESVKFSYKGVDFNGNDCSNVPENVTWKLSTTAYGKISSAGVLKSNGKKGKTTVYAMNGTQIIGKTTVKFNSMSCGGTHDFEYNNGKLVCKKCNFERVPESFVDDSSTKKSAYTGSARDANTGLSLLFENGELLKSKWIMNDQEMYHYNESGLGYRCNIINDVKSTCTVSGYKVYMCPECQNTYKVAIPHAPGHVYNIDSNGNKTCKVCGWKQKKLSDCKMILEYDKTFFDGDTKEPKIEIYDGDKLLQNGIDYYNTVYLDNSSIGKATARASAICIYYGDYHNDRGGYRGNIEKKFTISSSDITTYDIKLSEQNVEYTGSEIKPNVEINGLSNGKDYKVEYNNNINIGTANVIITGIGNYNKTITKTFNILPIDIRKSTLLLSRDSYIYTGKEIKPEVSVQGLVDGQDYVVKYENNINIGTGKIIITGIGKYNYSVEKNFSIVTKNINDYVITVAANSYTYTGKEIKPSVKIIGLKYGEDYTVRYEDNINVGTGRITIEGIGKYDQYIVKTFSIVPKSIAGYNIVLSSNTYTFTGKAIKPGIKITGLTYNKDYAVQYKNNVKAGTASVVITGINNFGKSATRTFKITAKDIRKYTVKLSGYTYIYNGKQIKPKVTVAGLNYGKDYKLVYKNNINKGTASVTVTGIGNYSKSIIKKFSIKSKSINKYKITYTSACVYTGKYIKSSVKISGLKYGRDFKLSYSNNKKVGTAVVKITGINNFTGQVTRKFKILKRLAAPKISKKVASKTSIAIYWKKISGAKSYVIYQYNSKTRKYSRIKTTKLCYIKIAKLKRSTEYRFIVSAALDGNGKYQGLKTKIIHIKTK